MDSGGQQEGVGSAQGIGRRRLASSCSRIIRTDAAEQAGEMLVPDGQGRCRFLARSRRDKDRRLTGAFQSLLTDALQAGELEEMEGHGGLKWNMMCAIRHSELATAFLAFPGSTLAR